MKNHLIIIEYDGTNFHGWQIQPNARTVQGELEKALSIVCNEEIHINGTSRTDAGVHAYGQAASFSGSFGIPVERIPIAANNLLYDAKIKSAEEKPLDFHARFDAKGKTYRYRISFAKEPDIFQTNYRYQLIESPDTSKMIEAGSLLVGTKDFASFMTAGGSEPESTVRTITSVGIKRFDAIDSKGKKQEEIEIRVTGDGFLYNMVRIIVGTLIDVGYGKIHSDKMEEIIYSCKRENAGHTAPANGLFLEKIFWEDLKG